MRTLTDCCAEPNIVCTQGARALLAKKSFSGLDSGAHQVHRIVQEYLEDPLSEGYLSGKFQQENLIEADVNANDELIELRVRQ
jgi:ATP-dependent Clp protease ATP-binding subunit ClpA